MTHNFKFVLGNDSYIEGECEFSEEVSFKIKSFSEPLPFETLQNFEKVVALIKDVSSSGIKKIVFKIKD